MSKAMVMESYGDADVFIEKTQDLPAPARGELRVRNTATGLNFIDIYQRRGLYPIALPAVLGSEAAGTVEAVGDGVDGIRAGDRVAYLASSGAYAEAINIPAAMAATIPDDVTDTDAAALFLKGLTVEMLVKQIFALKKGQACLVHAAAGGVGSLLCQWASYIGAHVIGVVGSEEKAATAKANGADDIIVRGKDVSIAAEVRRLTDNHGVDVVYDSVGEATFEASLDSLAVRGHMVTFGNASGPVPPVAPLDLTRRGSLTLTRPSLFHYATPDQLPQMAATLFQMVAGGHITARIGKTYPLTEISQAHKALESGMTQGSIVLTI